MIALGCTLFLNYENLYLTMFFNYLIYSNWNNYIERKWKHYLWKHVWKILMETIFKKNDETILNKLYYIKQFYRIVVVPLLPLICTIGKNSYVG